MSVERSQKEELEKDLEDVPSADSEKYTSEALTENPAYNEDIGRNCSDDHYEYINNEDKEEETSSSGERVSYGQETLFIPLGVTGLLNYI